MRSSLDQFCGSTRRLLPGAFAETLGATALTNLDAGVVVLRDLDEAIGLAIEHNNVRLQVFLGTWTAVDRGRAEVDALGLSGRLSVHHASALSVVEGRNAA